MTDTDYVIEKITEETKYDARRGKGNGHIAIEINSNNHDMDNVGRILREHGYRLSGVGGGGVYFKQ